MRSSHALPGVALLLAVAAASCNTPFSADGRSSVTPAADGGAVVEGTAAVLDDTVAAVEGTPERGPDARFAAEIRPLLEERCAPCHFAGGKMYERLPFDRPETIQSLGDELLTRIKADDERELILAFLRDFPGDQGRETASPWGG